MAAESDGDAKNASRRKVEMTAALALSAAAIVSTSGTAHADGPLDPWCR